VIKNTLAILGLLALGAAPAAGPALAADTNGPTIVAASEVHNAPPGAPYEKISLAIKGLPDFIPTMGMVYVDPKNLPEGPYLGYSREGKLVDTVYMITVKDFDAHKNVPQLAAPAGTVDHVGVYFNPGHAGIPEAHYHIVLWHVPKAQEALVAK
jgi:hypothetical protein